DWIMSLIEKALVWIIEKGKALLASLGIGKKEKDKKGKEGGGDVGKRVTWTVEEESHEMWIEVSGENATVMMASNGGTKVSKQLDAYEKKANDLKAKQDAERKATALQHITEARNLLNPVDQKADEAAKLVKEADVEPSKATEKEA